MIPMPSSQKNVLVIYQFFSQSQIEGDNRRLEYRRDILLTFCLLSLIVLPRGCYVFQPLQVILLKLHTLRTSLIILLQWDQPQISYISFSKICFKSVVPYLRESRLLQSNSFLLFSQSCFFPAVIISGSFLCSIFAHTDFHQHYNRFSIWNIFCWNMWYGFCFLVQYKLVEILKSKYYLSK